MKIKNENQDKNQLVSQLDQLNHKLATVNFNKSRFFIYNASPFKFALYNFIAGVFHSLGTLFGTIVIAAVIFYFMSTIDFVKPLINWIEEIGTQINWEKIMPLPDENLSPLIRPSISDTDHCQHLSGFCFLLFISTDPPACQSDKIPLSHHHLHLNYRHHPCSCHSHSTSPQTFDKNHLCPPSPPKKLGPTLAGRL